jgi:hypothetical protein
MVFCYLEEFPLLFKKLLCNLYILELCSTLRFCTWCVLLLFYNILIIWIITVDLVDLPDLGDKRSVNANDFVDSMQELHEKVKQKLQASNNGINRGHIYDKEKKHLRNVS